MENEIIPNTSNYTDIIIDKNLISTINLGVLYGKEGISGKNVGIEANSSLYGFTGGHVWKPLTILVDTTRTKEILQYNVTGTLQWKLLGTTIYSEYKTYAGFFRIK